MSNANSSKSFQDAQVNGRFGDLDKEVLMYLYNHQGVTARELSVEMERGGSSVFKESVSGTLTRLYQAMQVGRGESRKCRISGKTATTHYVIDATNKDRLDIWDESKAVPQEEKILVGENLAVAQRLLDLLSNPFVKPANKQKVLDALQFQLTMRNGINFEELDSRLKDIQFLSDKGI